MSDVSGDEDDELPQTFDEPDENPAELDYQPPISAIPPRVAFTEENQVEVSASPAYQCLDDLFNEGKLTGTRVAQLKAKYSELHEKLKTTRESEAKLLQEAKDYSAELEKQNHELEKSDNFPEGQNNNEVAKMRQQLLKYRNELAQIDERQYQHEYKIECAMEDKNLMQREFERMPKKGETEKKIKELHSTCDELRKEISQRQAETKNLREDLETKRREIQSEKKVCEDADEEKERLKHVLVNIGKVKPSTEESGDLIEVKQEPVSIAKETDRFTRQKNEVDKKMKVIVDDYEEKVEMLRSLEQQRQQLEEEKYAADTELDKQRMALDEKQRAYDSLMREHEQSRDKEAQLMADKAALDLSLRTILMEKKGVHEAHSRKQREKDKDIRSLKKAELQYKVAEDSLAHFKAVYDKSKGQLETAPKDDGSLNNKRKELQRDVDQTKRALNQQTSLTAVEQVKVEQSIADEGRLLYEQGDLRIEVVELTRLAAIKADEREQKARDFMRAEMRYHRAVEDLKAKQLQIQDNEKKFKEMQVQLKNFAKLYDVIKNERNKIVNLIQTSTQVSAEMREKIKILANEMEILRTAVSQKERLLQKTRLRHLNSIVIRDSLRNELAKQMRMEEEMREKRKQQKMEIEKLNLMINHAEETMVQLRRKYEDEVENRNARGIVLIERNEEVCIFCEKVNIQDTMIREGNVAVQSREEQLRFLRMQLQEEKRAIEVVRKNLPNKKNLDNELVTLQIQLAQCQDRMLELEKSIEDPADETRVRFLDGHDMTPNELKDKIQELETRLAEKEEQLLERELVFEQVGRLSERVKKRAETGKTDTLNLAKNVNEIKAKIKDTTRKMMAMVSELSMNQASALKLQATAKEKEAELEQCYIRMEKGEPPSDEIALEYEKYIRNEERRAFEVENTLLHQQEEDQYMLTDGVKSTAEPRPNAYIPDDESELPIPRPYGSHAPFKPQEAGSTMRHIRKPVNKPIEI